jgi:uncharacterized protein DUF6519
MKGDFTRVTNHAGVTRVLMQQGRVQLDADWNELVAIVVESQRRLAADLIGLWGGPAGDVGFKITNPTANPLDFEISPGTYYVDGLHCVAVKSSYLAQQDLPGEKDLQKQMTPWKALSDEQFGGSSAAPELESGGSRLVYLDVWERHVSAAEDPSLVDAALNGLDTATRAVLMSQARMFPLSLQTTAALPATNDAEALRKFRQKCLADLELVFPRVTTAVLAARAKKPEDDADPCLSAPDARYRGQENQLYRVEVHRGGPVGQATFKWSRDNGSVVFPVAPFREATEEPAASRRVQIKLDHLGRDDRTTLRESDWVELVDATHAKRGAPGPMARVVSVDRDANWVTLEFEPETPAAPVTSKFDGAILRRWDHRGRTDQLEKGAVCVEEGTDGAAWIALEDGIEVRFQAPKNASSVYRSGDYWLIPARTATGDIAEEATTARSPDGIGHHYAPLAVISANGTPTSLRVQFSTTITSAS